MWATSAYGDPALIVQSDSAWMNASVLYQDDPAQYSWLRVNKGKLPVFICMKVNVLHKEFREKLFYVIRNSSVS